MNEKIANVRLRQCFIGYFQEAVYKKNFDPAGQEIEPDSKMFAIEN